MAKFNPLTITVIIISMVFFISLIVWWRLHLRFDIPFAIGTDDRSMALLYGISNDSNVGKGIALCITSGGCNPLDECLSREVVFTCDALETQNYLLELKIATIRTLPYQKFWNMFGKGESATFSQDYKENIRELLSIEAARFWDKRAFYFKPRCGGLYKNASGPIKFSNNLCQIYWHEGYDAFLKKECVTAERQVQVVTCMRFHKIIAMHGWFHRHSRSFSNIGVIDTQWENNDPAIVLQKGVLRRARVANSFCKDYITRLYVTGSFVPHCCPRYMRPEKYMQLRSNVHRIIIIKGNMLETMRQINTPIDAFFPLDHLDYLSFDEVEQEAMHMMRLSKHLAPGTPIAIVKCVDIFPKYHTTLSRFFDVIDITKNLNLDGSDIYMVQSAWLLRRRSITT